jgi:hypothetical protein
MDPITNTSSLTTSEQLPPRYPKKTNQNYGLTMTVEQLWWYAGILQNSTLTPSSLRGRQEDIFIILNIASNLNIDGFSALHGIMVVNGEPRIYGDLLVAIMIQHPEFEDFWFEFEQDETNGITCKCTGVRKHRKPMTTSFSMKDAEIAGLSKKTVWKQYPKQMLMRRALNTMTHYLFPDALFSGIPVMDSPFGKDGYFVEDDEDNSSTDDSENSVKIQTKKPKPQPPTVTDFDSKKDKYNKLGIITKKYLKIILKAKNPSKDKIQILESYDLIPEAMKLNDEDALKTAIAQFTLTLIEYANSKAVNKGTLNYLKREYPKRQDDSPPSMEELYPLQNMCIAMINRLVDNYLPLRVHFTDLVKFLAQKNGVPESLILSKIPYIQKMGIKTWGRGEITHPNPNPELTKFLSEMDQKSDYTTIPLEETEEIDWTNTPLKLNDNEERLTQNEIIELTSTIDSYGIPLWDAIAPFVPYPDLRLFDREKTDRLIKHVQYLSIVSEGHASYLDNESLTGFKKFLNGHKNISFEVHAQNISVKSTGVFGIGIHTIPKQLLLDTDQFQQFQKEITLERITK